MVVVVEPVSFLNSSCKYIGLAVVIDAATLARLLAALVLPHVDGAIRPNLLSIPFKDVGLPAPLVDALIRHKYWPLDVEPCVADCLRDDVRPKFGHCSVDVRVGHLRPRNGGVVSAVNSEQLIPQDVLLE